MWGGSLELDIWAEDQGIAAVETGFDIKTYPMILRFLNGCAMARPIIG